MSTLKYRPDVDGLRAVAVLPVLFFHVGIPGTAGGYVGVDVFFVISGFLITSILHQEMGRGRFSFVRFYERRIRRLWPALVVVVAFTVLGAYRLLLPTALKDFGQSLVAVTVFASNVLFYQEAGYFDGPAELKPLLHTWSLAVEEQFYLFFPPFLLALHRFARRAITPALLVSLVVSFGISILFLPSHQSAVFYLLPFRAWEMLVGSVLAVGVIPSFRSTTFAHLSGLLGLAMILVSVVVYSAATPFPGLAAALPVLGSALVIHAGATEGGLAGRLLGTTPLVFVGKISYSLYLWHWPLIVFARHLVPDGELEPMHAFGLVVASLVAGAASWRFVEAPFRNAERFTARSMFVGAAVASVAWFGIGGALHVLRGLPGRFDEPTLRLAAAMEDFVPEPEGCREWPGPAGVAEGFCLIGSTESEEPTYFLWGDSHAGILVHGADAAASEHHRAGLYSNLAGCPPLVGFAKDESVADAVDDARCADVNQRVVRVLEAVPSIDRVVLVSRWSYYANGRGIGADAHNTVEIWPAAGSRGGSASETFEAGLETTLRTLVGMGKRVFVLRQVPEVEEYEASALATARMLRGVAADEEVATRSRIDVARVSARQASFDRVMVRFANEPSVTVLDTHEHFCDASSCFAVRDGRPLYFDNNHVTTTTSRELAPVFEVAFAD
jgi:peptidoglycan/LPS O-acetylase OafA/YrhL